MLAALQIIIAVLAGVATAFQPGVNTRFAESAGARIHGGVINFAVGLAAMLLTWAVARAVLATPSPEPARLAQGPWWMWLGGVLGAFFVTTAVFLAPKMGAANYLVALIAGQLVASLLIDHYGLMGLPQIALSPMRIAGLTVLVLGVIMIKRG